MTNTTNVNIKRIRNDATLPNKAHTHDAGFDLVAAEDTIIEPGETVIVPTGIALELPPGYEAQVRPRSGITVKTKLRVQLGTIDANYRGEVGVIIDNAAGESGAPTVLNYLAKKIDGKRQRANDLSNGRPIDYNTYLIRKGDRIGQLVIQRLPDVVLSEVDSLGESERGGKGFGSSGVMTE